MKTTTVNRTLELDIEIEVEVSGRYRPARTHGDPGSCYPAEYPEAEVVSAQTEDGWDVMKFLSPQDIESACQSAIESAVDADDGPEDPDDERDRRIDMARERRWED